ncbi:bifunctional diguanylate cyclase/phosphodiesterase [Janthinobacterium sp. NKUCC06_STL]|uniref:putative bifunctional diguanylate cyclase/phosphodiesterase n=1 Tax=Janthinobacterium sp. NKUCC06_STL TaxID=2842127 RepID=UPI001C5A9A38|nr:EAL domain-containing protein [Janthinobacterium sp. NKUCC06_STL]MBW3507341.1 EAL domain-containing protein [Janthinobacterium sp. NKUCC06_STL]
MMTPLMLPSAQLRGDRIARLNLLAAAAMLAMASLLLILFQLFSLQASLQRNLQIQADMLAPAAAQAMRQDNRLAAQQLLAPFAAAPHVRQAILYSPYGTPFARYARSSNDAVPAVPRNGMHLDYLDGSAAVLTALPGGGALYLRASLAPLYASLAQFAAFTLLVCLCAFGLTYLMVRRTRTAAQHAESHLHYLAHVDPVTQLPNRHEFNDALAYALARADRQDSSVGLLLLDLDNFKVVNDTLGHHCGDQLLKLVSDRLVAILRGTDIICRIGGDEFVVIVEPADDASEMASVARKILAVLAAPFDLEGHQLYVSASIGVSLYPFDAQDVATLTRNADTAMYHAKHQGKNRYAVFKAEMELRAQRRLRMEANLRKALQNEELYLHYQPQIDLRSGRIVGVEALIRWNCRDMGQLSPAEFIPVAEESGIIVDLGRWVLQSACRQAALWCKAGLLDSLEHVAVNLSACQARDPGLMDDIRAILDETQLPHGLLELEITEGVLMDNVHANVELMRRLQEAGIHLSIDDFGTGYSSMSYLQRLPIDQLKIDRSFVHDLPGEGEAIVTAIIAMAHSLHLKVVAEGVETLQQVEFLRKADCDNVQGFFFARPMTAAQLTALLLERRDWSTRTILPA